MLSEILNDGSSACMFVFSSKCCPENVPTDKSQQERDLVNAEAKMLVRFVILFCL
jgi:hypothetical protein